MKQDSELKLAKRKFDTCLDMLSETIEFVGQHPEHCNELIFHANEVVQAYDTFKKVKLQKFMDEKLKEVKNDEQRNGE